MHVISRIYKNKIVMIFVLITAIFFSGCDKKQEEPKAIIPSVGGQVFVPIEKEVTTTKIIQPKQRFELKKVQTFEDNDAYRNIRNIYILTDNDTKKEYIGISGIGITEQGSHISSKQSVQDER